MERSSLSISLGLAATLALFGCARATPGAEPHDMGATHHEAAAQAELAEASAHAAEQASAGPVEVGTCIGRPKRANEVAGEACWSSLRNPSDAHRRAAEEHKRQAADHRAASAALRDAEGRACTGLADEDRDMSPFEHAEDIRSVMALREPNDASGKLVGAVITFVPVPGMDPAWLQRVIDCHLARNASLGHVVPEMPSCPLVPNHVTATVAMAGDAVMVTVRSDDPASAKEVLSRAERLRSGSK